MADPHAEPHPDVAGFLLGALDEAEAAEFERHLADCPACQDEMQDLSSLPGLLSDMAPFEELPPDLEARTFEAIAQAAVADEPVIAPVVSLSQARERRRWSSRQMILTAAAATVVGVVGLGAGLGIAHRQPAAQAVEHLVAPDGGQGRGTATIRATLTGLTINLNVHGLAPSRPGTVYTCWLVGSGDTLSHQNRVSVGSFVVGANGSANVVWNTGASLHRFPTLGVTLEPDNGDPLHQGPKVLEDV
ncbi:MAG TPA: anti-sigma factor [Acidimicrobiales bacterium]|jgi:hypothetical protein|nr:anti-sigma factor [Acidimicrobiales bacterium]